jgi:hypothetical protein
MSSSLHSEQTETHAAETPPAAAEGTPPRPGHRAQVQPLTDDLDALIVALPPKIGERLRALEDVGAVIEVVMDLGRKPEARFGGGGEVVLLDREIRADDIQYVVDHVGSFGEDNRAGIERTLHRISAIRNRSGKIVGLTCRVGRAVIGTIDIVDDLVESGQSILIQRDRRRRRHPASRHRPRPTHAGAHTGPAARGHDRGRREPHA